jgi:protein TonB
MKKIFFLFFFVLFTSFSFGQSKKKAIVTYCPEVKDTIRIVKVNTGNFNDDDLTINPLNSIQAVINDDNEIYGTAGIEVKPEFPGGIQNFYAFVGKNYKMPDEVGLNGKVYVSFVVEKDGTLSNIKILRDIGYGTGKEAIRVLKASPKWNPGEQNGRKVRCSYSLPISLPQ